MNNKGFTLVELLAVLVILVSISLVAVGGISASLEKRDDMELVEQQKLAIGAAKIYFSLNDVNCVDLKTLKNGNYFSSDDKIDRLNLKYTIMLKENGPGIYDYVYSDTICD